LPTASSREGCISSKCKYHRRIRMAFTKQLSDGCERLGPLRVARSVGKQHEGAATLHLSVFRCCRYHRRRARFG
jgi:hypothetical protein